MKIFDIKTLLEGRVEESILVHSFVEYKSKGGEKDAFDIYAGFKEKAKELDFSTKFKIDFYNKYNQNNK